MSSWRDEMKVVETEKRRWAVLAHLEATAPSRSLNADILILGCRANGIPTTSDQMQSVMEWLSEKQYISMETLGNMVVATLRRSGREVAQGHRVVEGLIPFGLDT